MKSVRQIKDILGLNTVHQARNRIKAINDVLQPHIKRGENNEILVAEEGVRILTKLQDLYESGLLLSEAAEVVRSEFIQEKGKRYDTESYGSKKDQVKPEQKSDLVTHLREEVRFQRNLISSIISEGGNGKDEEEEKWWLDWL